MTAAKPRTKEFTAAELDLIDSTAADWMQVGTSIEPVDPRQAEEAVRAVYRTAGLEEPKIVLHMSSPAGVAVGVATLRQLRGQLWGQLWDQLWDQLGGQLGGQLRDQLWDQLGDQLWGQLGGQLWDQLWDQLGDQLWGQLWDQLWDQLGDQLWDQLGGQLRGQLGDQLWDQLWDQLRADARDLTWYQLWGSWESFWLAFYDVGFRLTRDTKLRPRLDAMLHAARVCGSWFPMPGAVVIGDRPTKLLREQGGRLHCASGPAVEYADGWRMFAWHGRRVPEWVILHPTPKTIANEPNAEVRRCAIESYGWDRFMQFLCAKPIASARDIAHPLHDATVELFDVPRDVWPSPVRLVLVRNASPEPDGTYRRYGLTVPADISDPIAALAWTAGVDADTYRLLARAS